jgi:hypothetical protein
MKGNSVERPQVMVKSEGKTQVLYNITEITKEDIEGKTQQSFDYDYVEISGEITRGKIVDGVIMQTHSKDAELALINNELLSPGTKEYQEYQKLRTFAKGIADNIGFPVEKVIG